MHNRKWSKTLKKSLSILIVSFMLIPSMGQALSPNEYFENNSFKLPELTLNNQLKPQIMQIQEGIDTNSEKEVSIIVQFKSDPLIQSKEISKNPSSKEKIKKEKIDKEHKTFKEFLKNKEKATTFSNNTKIKHEYKNMFNGVAMTVKGTDIEKLLKSDVVKTIWKDESVQLELPKETKTNAITPYMASSKPLIGVDELHSKGITGEGIKVGVIDTGIDFNHPDLTDNYKGEKSDDKPMDESLGWDFVDDDSSPMETTYQDWKDSEAPEINYNSGSTYYTSHGTHVSGTVAGTGENKESEFATTGVAPDADLYGYRVLGPYGSGYTSDIVAAVEKSVEDGMDVINLSLGANINDPLFPTAVAVNNAMLAGVVTVVANGNSGPLPGTVGTPGTAPLPISVGASSTSLEIAKYDVVASNDTKTEGRLLARDFTDSFNKIEEEEIVFCGYGYSWNFPSEVKGKIALIERGELSFNDKVINAKNAGAKAVILFNNVGGEIPYYLGESTNFIPSVSIDMETGNKLKEALGKSEEVKVELNITEYEGTKADELADFSSRGPVNNGDIKPDIVAPGVSIMSTYPEFINHPQDGESYNEAYARISGTSMAAPHVAGLSALILQENKEYDAFDVKLALMNTADDLAKDYGVNEMGAGRINAVEAVNPNIVIKYTDESITVDENGEMVEVEHDTGAISFGVVPKSDKTTTIKNEFVVSNKTGKNENFDVEVEFVTPTQTNGAQDAIKNKIKLDVRKSVLSNKNKDTKVNFELTIPKGAEEGIYQGYIKLTNKKDKSQTHNIPFSAMYVEPGLAPIKLYTNSATNDLDWVNPWLQPGLAADIKINTPVEKIDILVRDYETDKLIGYRGTMETAIMVPGVTYTIQDVMNMLLAIYPVDENNNISPLYKKLEEGKYKVELVATDRDGNTTKKSQPFIVDNTPATISEVSHESGVYEISEDMFTTETDDNGVEQSAFWINGKVNDESIAKLKEIGVDTKLSDMKMNVTVNGYPNTTLKINDDGSYKFGVTMDDVAYGGSEIRTLPIDLGGSLNYNLVPKYHFIKEGEPYLYMKADKKEVNEGEEVTITTDLNNIADTSTFSIPLEYQKGYKLKNIKINESAKAMLDEKGYTAELTHNEYPQPWADVLEIKVQIKDSEKNHVNINGDIPLVDATFTLEDDTSMDMYASYFLCFGANLTSKDGKNVDLYPGLVYDTIKNVQQTSTAVFGESAQGLVEAYRYDLEKFEKYLWLEDSKGNKYPVEYNENEGKYFAKNLPATKEEYKVISDVPGHFKNYIVTSLYREIDGELAGKYSFLYYQDIALAGDSNGDGVIDIKDAREVADVYNKSENIEGKDFNFDGVVDDKDMKYVVDNYLSVNTLEENAPQPVEDSDRSKLEAILDEVKYNN